MSMKNPPTPAGIQPATFRFVVQHLNHCATAVPLRTFTYTNLPTHVVSKIMHKTCGLLVVCLWHKNYICLWTGSCFKQERQCTFNVTLRHIRITIVAVEKQNVLHILSVILYSCIRYPACKAHTH